MKNLYTFLFAFVITISGTSQSYQFGIVNNDNYSFSIVAIPDFDGTDTDISDVGFAIMLPAGNADIINSSQFNGRNWTLNEVTATQLSGFGLGDGTRDAFVLNLPPGQSIVSHTTNNPIVLVSFDVSNSPTSGAIEILTNADPIAIGLGGVVDSFYNANIDETTTQNYYGGIASGQENFMFETLSTEDIELENYTISVYPNPVTDLLHVSSELAIEKLTLYDILGKEILALKNTNNLSVAHLESGSYILKIQTPIGDSTKQIIIK
ncbi:T9SS type A sorting domain-containing protein [uncultured Psychroserpens sp.]|uniref:T9SS type A sorting domain-containing protein n=1 Tax=uncultured Psychroserpens sp. TaxID=255436 RepID=UPI002637038F|nr:T9SS type A sorting domain-containing protein [uncultured Psychroserpens sp.]